MSQQGYHNDGTITKKDGKYDGAIQPRIIGVNDAGGAVSGSAYTSNLTAFWSWASKRYPDAKMVICGVTPLENNTSEANAATLRSAASSYVSGVADSRLKYINLGSAFDRTVSSNYVGSDPAGSRVQIGRAHV